VNSQFVQLIASLQKNSQESSRPKGNQVGPGKLTRRNFCGRILLTLTALFLLAKKLIGRPSSQLSHQLAYPPMKIQDAESVMPGSFLNFNYPGLGDPAILVRAPEENTSPTVGNAPISVARSISTGRVVVWTVPVITERTIQRPVPYSTARRHDL